jgi:putative addiction module CopG family antidote
MATHQIELPSGLDRFVEEQLEEGSFRDTTEIVAAGLRLLEQQRQEDKKKLALLQSLAAKGFDQIDQGQGIEINGSQELADYLDGINRRAAAIAERRLNEV